jgi:hypothetical protein
MYGRYALDRSKYNFVEKIARKNVCQVQVSIQNDWKTVKYQPLQADAEFLWTEVFAFTVFCKPGNLWMLLYKYLQPSQNQDLFLDLLGHWKQRSKHEWWTWASLFRIQFLNIHTLYSNPCKHTFIFTNILLIAIYQIECLLMDYRKGKSWTINENRKTQKKQ